MRFPLSVAFAAIAIACSSFPLSAQWMPVAQNILQNPVGTECAMNFHNGVLWLGSQSLEVSTDLGKTFTFVQSPVQGNILHIDFIDAQHGIVGDKTNIYTTSNGGTSWTSVISGSSETIWDAILLGSPNDILIVSGYPGTAQVSHDGGHSWSNHDVGAFPSRAIYKPQSGKTYVFGGDMVIGANVWESTDRGTTWLKHRGTVDFDSWGFEVDGCSEQYMYVANEDYASPTDNISEMFVSNDGGSTWKTPIKFNGTYFCGSVSVAEGIVYSQTLGNGIYRSTDHGVSWVTIGGPSAQVDSRLVTALDRNTVLACDRSGSLFITHNSGGDSLPRTVANTGGGFWLASDTATFTQRSCPGSENEFGFGFSACNESATLVLATLMDSAVAPGLTLLDPNTPRSIGSTDVLQFRLQLEKNIVHARLHIQYSVNGVVHDTTVSIVALNPIAYTASAITSPSVHIPLRDTAFVPVAVQLPSPLSSATDAKRTIYSLRFDTTALRPVLPLRIQPPGGWSVETATLDSDLITVALLDTSHASLAASMQLGAVALLANTRSPSSSVISIVNLQVETVSGNHYFCFDPEFSTIAHVDAEGRFVNASMHPFDVRVHPNPAKDKVILEFAADRQERISVTVRDLLGRTMYSSAEREMTAGSHALPLDLSSCATGAYVVRIQSGTSVHSERIVINR